MYFRLNQITFMFYNSKNFFGSTESLCNAKLMSTYCS